MSKIFLNQDYTGLNQDYTRYKPRLKLTKTKSIMGQSQDESKT